jgi:hypothetical protein
MDPTRFQVFSGDRQGSLPMMTVGRQPVITPHHPRIGVIRKPRRCDIADKDNHGQSRSISAMADREPRDEIEDVEN